MSWDPVTVKSSPLVEELQAAERLMADLRLELRLAEDRIQKLAARASSGTKMPAGPVIMILRANADRVSDRAVGLHDIARRVADIMRDDVQGPTGS